MYHDYRILGEGYNVYFGLDEYDAYDPFDEDYGELDDYIDEIADEYFKGNECKGKCRYCDAYKCRCECCFALVEENGKWYCDEYEDYCENIKVCGEFKE